MNTIDTLKKSDAIKRTVARNIAAGAWLKVATDEATAWLDKSEKARRADVVAYVEGEYRAAGLDSRGRKQG